MLIYGIEAVHKMNALMVRLAAEIWPGEKALVVGSPNTRPSSGVRPSRTETVSHLGHKPFQGVGSVLYPGQSVAKLCPTTYLTGLWQARPQCA